MRPAGRITIFATVVVFAVLRTAYRNGDIGLAVGTVLVAGTLIRIAIAADKAIVQRQVGASASVEIPAHLIEEYSAVDTGVRMALQPQIITALVAGTSPEQVIDDVRARGWSRNFATWIVYLLGSNRGGVEIKVPN